MYHLFKVTLPLFLLVSIASHHSIDAVLRGSHEHLLSSRELGTPKKNKEDFEYPEGNPFQAIKAEINELSLAIADLASLEALNDLEKRLDDSLENLNEKIEQLTNTCCSNNGSTCIISDGNGMNSLELKSECWTKVLRNLKAGNNDCLENNGEIDFDNNVMTLWGSGVRHGNFVFASYQGKITKFDFTGTTTYVKWKAVNENESCNQYAQYYSPPRMLYVDPSRVIDELYLCPGYNDEIKDIATSGIHTTDHIYSGSVLIENGTWYYTTLEVFDATGNFHAITCTADYGCVPGDNDFVSEHIGVMDDQATTVGTLMMGLSDNKCATDNGLTIAEIKTTASLYI